MFGHLKAADFIHLIEGAENGAGGALQAKHRSHLNACGRCAEALASARSLYSEMVNSALVAEHEEIPEPDWFQFRAGVRNAMLSRAAQRQSRMNFRPGWFLQPSMTWGLAIAFVAGLGAGLLIWNSHGTIPAPSESASIGTFDFLDTEQAAGHASQVASLDTTDVSIFPDDFSASPQTSIFVDLARLDDIQSEKLQHLLETRETVDQQDSARP